MKLLMAIGFLTLHLTVLEVIGYEMTGGVLLLGAVLMLGGRPRNTNRNITYLIAMLLILLLKVSADLFTATLNTLDYVTTLSQFVLLGFILLWSSGTDFPKAYSWLRPGAMAALTVIAIVSVAQSVTGYLGSDALFNLFGEAQYLYAYNPQVGSVLVPRAQVFYLEPSFASFVVTALFVVATIGATQMVDNRLFVWLLVLAGVANLAIQSLLGLVSTLAMSLLAFGFRGIPTSVRWLTPTSILVALVSLGSGTLDRLATLNLEGSSVYYRLMAPVENLIQLILDKPLGAAFGSQEAVVGAWGIWMFGSQGVGTSLDNGYFVFIFYFGILGLSAAFLYLVWVTIQFAKGLAARDMQSAIFFFWLLVAPLFSGAVMSPQFALVMALTIVARLNPKRKYEVEASPFVLHKRRYSKT